MIQKTTLAVSILIALLLGVFAYYAYENSPSPTATSTQVVVINNPPVKTNNDVAGSPFVNTNSSVAITDNTAVMAGSVNPNGAFTSYLYEYGKTTALGNKSNTQTIGSGFEFISAPAYITGLTKDTTYYYRIVAQNKFGSEAGKQSFFTTTHGNPSPVGFAPSIRTVNASSISQNSANINGEINPNKNASSYWFEYGTSLNLGRTTAFISIGDGSINLNVSQSLNNLTPGTIYYFRINAQNNFGTVNGQIQSFQTTGTVSIKAPGVRTGSATSINNTSANLKGSVDPNGSETTYWFEYSSDSLLSALLSKNTDAEKLAANLNSTNISADISGLNSRTTYYFRLIAQNSSGTVRGERMSFRTK